MSKYCIACLVSKKKAIDKRDWSREKKDRLDKLKTHSDWLNELQKVFNTYIRTRDKSKPCISCGQMLIRKYDAGHYFAVGSYPNLRFNEDNVHGQCVACNQHKHGNVSEYAIKLPDRIGQEQYDKLLEDRNNPLHLSTEEIKELIQKYKQKIKEL
jgi:hypothetical protein